MFTPGVVVAFDVFEEFQTRLLNRPVSSDLNFQFERSDEGFGPGVIVRVGPGRHALAHFRSLEDRTKKTAGILAASIAVKDQIGLRPTCRHGLLHGLGHQLGAHILPQTPAHDLTRTQIDHYGQVEPAPGVWV